MINSFNISLISGGEEDIKRFLKSVASDLKRFLRLPEDFPVYVYDSFDEDMEKKYGESDFGNQPKFRKMTVVYEEANDDFEDNSLFFQKEEYLSIFSDTETGVKLSPSIKNFKYNLSIEIKAKSKTMLSACLNKIRERDSLIKKNFRHKEVETVTYLDNRVLKLLNEINKKRQTIYPGETLSDYIKKYRSVNLKTVNSGGDSSKNILGIECRFTNIYGMLTTDANGLKIEYNAEDKEYVLSLSYDVNACLPINLNVVYPSMIFNSVLPRSMITATDPYKDSINTPQYIDEYDKLTRIASTLYTDVTRPYVSIPEWDISNIEGDTYYSIVFSALTGMIDHDPTTPILNLSDLGGVLSIKEAILQFLRDGEWTKILDLLMSIFMVNLYVCGKKAKREYLSMDSDLNIYYNGPVDLKCTYRVTFSTCTNPVILDRDAYLRLVKNEAVTKYVNNLLVIGGRHNLIVFGADGDQKPLMARTVQTSSIQAASILEYKK